MQWYQYRKQDDRRLISDSMHITDDPYTDTNYAMMPAPVSALPEMSHAPATALAFLFRLS